MKLRLLATTASVLALLASCTTTGAAAGRDAVLQETASLMVSIGQHGEGLSTADIADLSAQLDVHVAASPNDPYILKLAAQSRRALSDYSQDRAQRVALRHAALAELDRVIVLAKPSDPPRTVVINGMESEIDLKDLADLRASLFHQVTTDR